ncbi:MAG TPA: histone deacetylase [Terriglobia bacterium]|nr:histone deacetylase [Terriglobia bacterium]
MQMKTGIILDDIFLEHDPGLFHPERRERLVSIQEGLATYANREKLRRLTSRKASEDELLLVHSSSHIRKVSQTSGRSSTRLDPDTSTSAHSYEAALHAAGSLPVLIDALFEKEIQNGFALVRPPGHHAEPDRAMGFCLFNNIAIGAAYALKKHGLERVLVLDFDVHHGNGTQRAFYDRNDVLFISTHQYPLYPGTGDLSELGDKAGLGYTLNFPLPAGTGDPTYNSIYKQIIYPVSKAFAPQLVLVSAGYDAYVSDPLAGMAMTPEGFAGLTQTIVRLAHETCAGKLVFILEGGYHLDGLRSSTLRTLDFLSGQEQRVMEWPPTPQFESILDRTRQTFGHFWKF